MSHHLFLFLTAVSHLSLVWTSSPLSIHELSSASGAAGFATKHCQPKPQNPWQPTGWKIVTPNSPEGIYYQARIDWNMYFNTSFPCAVVYCRDSTDVSNAVQWANFNKWPIAVRSGGHSYEGFSLSDRGVIIDVHNISTIEVVTSGYARVGAGTMLIDLYLSLAAAGWTVPGGSCATVGVAGFTLGGGFGYLGRKYGVLSDSVIAAEMVLANGTTVTANSTHHTDLLWALKGGGNGNFGVVTYLTFALSPIPKTVIGIEASWDMLHLHDVVDAWQNWAPFTDERMTSHMLVGTEIGPSFAGVFIGPKATATKLFQEFLHLVGHNTTTKPTTTQRTWVQSVYWLAGCSDPYKCKHPETRTSWKAKSDFVTTPFTINGTGTIKEWLTTRKDNQSQVFAGLQMDSYGGQINKIASNATAFVHRNTLFSIQYLEYWLWNIDNPVRSLDWIRGFYNDMRPHVSGQAYRNYPDTDLEHWEQAYYGGNYERLQQVKQQYDPSNVFHYQQSIRLP